MAAGPSRALIIESDQNRAIELRAALESLSIECQVAADADAGWKAFARYRPSHVLAALRCGDAPGGDYFLRKLNSEYLGTMPAVYLTCTETELATAGASDPTGFAIWPIAQGALESIFSKRRELADTAGRQVTRLRELYELSLLGSDMIRELDFVASRATLGFQVSDCIVWGPEKDEHWPRATKPLSETEWAFLRVRCQLALQVGTTVVISMGASGQAVHQGAGLSLLAAPLGPVGENPLAGICLVSNASKRFSSEEQDSLRILASRLSTELAWMSAHNRLVDEHEKLRQTALIDPMLGIWTRPALEQAIADQITSARQHNASLALVLMDYSQLRAINDRYGHLVGDAVLAHFAKIVSSCLRPQDQIGRFGGDEIAVLLVGTTLHEAREIAATIVKALKATPYQLEGGARITPNVHAGITSIAEGEATSEGAFSRAHTAMDSARSANNSLESADPSRTSDTLDFEPEATEMLSAGSTLGGMYRILHEISRGAMGVVYRCEDLGLGRPVAIKVLRSDLSSDKELVAKFRNEATLLASLRHRNLVQVFSFGTEGDEVYFVMELVEGEPLSQIVSRLGREGEYIDLEAVAKIVEEMAEALDAIHSLGIVHRDVKPENVLVDRINDRAVLVDVGIAKRPDDARDAAGTPGYAAPESFMEADESPATDVYGLAATTYAALTGSPPYQGEELRDVVCRQLTEKAPAPSSYRGDLDAAVDSVLATALAADPTSRYRSATAFAIALTRALKRCAPAPQRRRTDRSATAKIRSETVREAQVSTYRLAAPVIPTSTASSIGYSRGALFRVASVNLANQLGAQWMAAVTEADATVAEALKPTTPPQSWHPSESLFWLLRCADGHHDDPALVARNLGSAMMAATLGRFFGADPATQNPSTILKAAESYWRRYHSWGALSVHTTTAEEALVELREGPAEPLFCQLLSGSFSRIVTLAGAANATCHKSSCLSRGADLCSFTVQWSNT